MSENTYGNNIKRQGLYLTKSRYKEIADFFQNKIPNDKQLTDELLTFICHTLQFNPNHTTYSHEYGQTQIIRRKEKRHLLKIQQQQH